METIIENNGAASAANENVRPDSLNDMLAGEVPAVITDPGSGNVSDGGASVPPEGGNNADQPSPSGGGFDYDKWLAGVFPEVPEGGVAKVDTWAKQRIAFKKATQELGKLSIDLDDARSALAEARKAGGNALPEAEAVKKLAAELEAVRQEKATALQEWEAHKAKEALESNHSFLAEFDGRRVALMDEAGEVAKEAGVSDDVVKAAFSAGTEYQLTRALADVDDETAARLIREKAIDFLKLGRERESAVKAPVDSLKKWRDYDEQMRGQLAMTVNKQVVERYVGAVPEAMKALENSPFFKTAAGKAVIDDLAGQFEAGQMPDVPQVIAALASQEAADFYQQAWMDGRQRITDLERELSRYVRADPSQSGARPSVARETSGGFDPERFFGR